MRQRAGLRSGPVNVRVPATSANLGPGYDTLALALSLHDEVEVEVVESGLDVVVAGEGAGSVARDEQHLVVRALRAAFDVLGEQPPGLRLDCTNRIPHGRGLGSSAAAIVGGIVAARALVDDGERRLTDDAVLALATELEGHPDNVAACLLGGLTIAWTEPAGVRAARVEPMADLHVLAVVPPEPLSTEQARRLLPSGVPHADAAANVARAALLVTALRDRPDLLLPATEDRLHQDYRAPAMPAGHALVMRLRSHGVPAVVSGAGPTVLALLPPGADDRVVANWTPHGHVVLALQVDRSGAAVLGRPAER